MPIVVGHLNVTPSQDPVARTKTGALEALSSPEARGPVSNYSYSHLPPYMGYIKSEPGFLVLVLVQ